MAKRVSYSIPLRAMWKKYKDWCKATKSADMIEFYRRERLIADCIPDRLVRQSKYLALNLWRKDYEKKLLHIWLEQKELRDFLRDELPLKDLEGIKQYLKEEGEQQKTEAPELGMDLEWVRYDIAVHVPNETDGYAFSFAIMHDGTISLLYCSDTGKEPLHESQYEEYKTRTDEESVNLVRDFTLAVNLLAYMRCFPECVRDGVPDTNSSNIYRYKDRSVQLGISDKITETIKGAMRPHFRRGYFKRLSSPFYTNKRGQLIFVSETMVNAMPRVKLLKCRTMKVKSKISNLSCYPMAGTCNGRTSTRIQNYKN